MGGEERSGPLPPPLIKSVNFFIPSSMAERRDSRAARRSLFLLPPGEAEVGSVFSPPRSIDGVRDRGGGVFNFVSVLGRLTTASRRPSRCRCWICFVFRFLLA